MLFLSILEFMIFDFSKFEQLSSPKFTKIQSSESLKLPKMTFFDRFNSHFESFCSRVSKIYVENVTLSMICYVISFLVFYYRAIKESRY